MQKRIERKHLEMKKSFVAIFFTVKIFAGQDRVFLFWAGLVNYEELEGTLQFILVQASAMR
jgi:hypothetical protein